MQDGKDYRLDSGLRESVISSLVLFVKGYLLLGLLPLG
jgi:hypothetical protein